MTADTPRTPSRLPQTTPRRTTGTRSATSATPSPTATGSLLVPPTQLSALPTPRRHALRYSLPQKGGLRSDTAEVGSRTPTLRTTSRALAASAAEVSSASVAVANEQLHEVDGINMFADDTDVEVTTKTEGRAGGTRNIAAEMLRAEVTQLQSKLQRSRLREELLETELEIARLENEDLAAGELERQRLELERHELEGGSEVDALRRRVSELSHGVLLLKEYMFEQEELYSEYVTALARTKSNGNGLTREPGATDDKENRFDHKFWLTVPKYIELREQIDSLKGSSGTEKMLSASAMDVQGFHLRNFSKDPSATAIAMFCSELENELAKTQEEYESAIKRLNDRNLECTKRIKEMSENTLMLQQVIVQQQRVIDNLAIDNTSFQQRKELALLGKMNAELYPDRFLASLVSSLNDSEEMTATMLTNESAFAVFSYKLGIKTATLERPSLLSISNDVEAPTSKSRYILSRELMDDIKGLMVAITSCLEAGFCKIEEICIPRSFLKSEASLMQMSNGPSWIGVDDSVSASLHLQRSLRVLAFIQFAIQQRVLELPECTKLGATLASDTLVDEIDGNSNDEKKLIVGMAKVVCQLVFSAKRLVSSILECVSLLVQGANKTRERNSTDDTHIDLRALDAQLGPCGENMYSLSRSISAQCNELYQEWKIYAQNVYYHQQSFCNGDGMVDTEMTELLFGTKYEAELAMSLSTSTKRTQQPLDLAADISAKVKALGISLDDPLLESRQDSAESRTLLMDFCAFLAERASWRNVVQTIVSDYGEKISDENDQLIEASGHLGARHEYGRAMYEFDMCLHVLSISGLCSSNEPWTNKKVSMERIPLVVLDIRETVQTLQQTIAQLATEASKRLVAKEETLTLALRKVMDNAIYVLQVVDKRVGDVRHALEKQISDVIDVLSQDVTQVMLQESQSASTSAVATLFKALAAMRGGATRDSNLSVRLVNSLRAVRDCHSVLALLARLQTWLISTTTTAGTSTSGGMERILRLATAAECLHEVLVGRVGGGRALSRLELVQLAHSSGGAVIVRCGLREAHRCCCGEGGNGSVAAVPLVGTVCGKGGYSGSGDVIECDKDGKRLGCGNRERCTVTSRELVRSKTRFAVRTAGSVRRAVWLRLVPQTRRLAILVARAAETAGKDMAHEAAIARRAVAAERERDAAVTELRARRAALAAAVADLARAEAMAATATAPETMDRTDGTSRRRVTKRGAAAMDGEDEAVDVGDGGGLGRAAQRAVLALQRQLAAARQERLRAVVRGAVGGW